MASITFRFLDTTSLEDVEAGLREIRSWPKVRHSGPLKPDAKDPQLQRMHYVDLEKGVEVGELMEKISRLPGVESVTTPTPRKLIF